MNKNVSWFSLDTHCENMGTVLAPMMPLGLQPLRYKIWYECDIQIIAKDQGEAEVTGNDQLSHE